MIFQTKQIDRRTVESLIRLKKNEKEERREQKKSALEKKSTSDFIAKKMHQNYENLNNSCGM